MSSSDTGHESAREIDEWALAAILRGLAPFLSSDLLHRAVGVARRISDSSDLIEALCGLGPYLQSEPQLEAAREALSLARCMRNDRIDDRFDTAFSNLLLDEIAPWLPVAAMEEVLAMIAAPDFEAYERVDVVTELMPYLPDALKPRALEIVWEPSAPSRSYYRMSDIAPHLTPDLALRIHEAILEQGDLHYHALTLVRLASRLPSDVRASGIEFALSAVREVEYVSVRTTWLSELAPHLPPKIRSKVLAELLAEIRQVDNAGVRAGALTELAPHLSEDEVQSVLREAVVAARSLQRIVVRTSFLVDIVPLLSGTEKDEALREIFAFLEVPADAGIRNTLLSKIVPYLSDQAQADAIAEIGETENNCSYLLSPLAPCLGKSAQREALAVAGKIAHAGSRADALREFAIHFNGAHKISAVHELATLLCDLAGTEPTAEPSQPEIDAAVAGALEALTHSAE